MKTEINRDMIPVDVECYSGFKADEYPVRFFLNNMKFEIKEVTDRWYQTDHSPGSPKADYFKVSTADEKQYILKRQSNKWYLLIKGESLNFFP
jgi:hypothetical protein